MLYYKLQGLELQPKATPAPWPSFKISLVVRKTVFGISDQVRHKPGCTATEDDKKLEISDLESRGIVYPCRENKGADQLRGYREADLRLCFRTCKKPVFSQRGSNRHLN